MQMALIIQGADRGTQAFVLAVQLVMMVMLGLAVFYDAKAHAGRQATFWGILVGCFGLVPGIIYLCMRKRGIREPVACSRCRTVYGITMPYCPVCGLQNQDCAPFWDPQLPAFRKKAKIYLTLWLCLYGGLFLFALAYSLFQAIILA